MTQSKDDSTVSVVRHIRVSLFYETEKLLEPLIALARAYSPTAHPRQYFLSIIGIVMLSFLRCQSCWTYMFRMCSFSNVFNGGGRMQNYCKKKKNSQEHKQ